MVPKFKIVGKVDLYEIKMVQISNIKYDFLIVYNYFIPE